MDMTGERRIPAPRQIVWDALNDPEVLKASIPGCETLEKTSDTTMKAAASIKLGPISARFNGNVTLSDIEPPTGYTITGEGQGGVAGFAKGGAAVKLSGDGGGTLLAYEVHAQVGGKLAQLGARLIDASAKQMAEQFFDRFTEQVKFLSPGSEVLPSGELAGSNIGSEPEVTIARTVAKAPASAVSLWALIPREPYGWPLAAWIGGGFFALIVLLSLMSLR